MQDKKTQTKQDKKRQGVIIKDKASGHKTRHNKTTQDKARQSKTRQDKIEQDKTRQNKAVNVMS
jgi:hypothetical protein